MKNQTKIYPTNLSVLVKQEAKYRALDNIPRPIKKWSKIIFKAVLSGAVVIWAVYTLIFLLVNIGNPVPLYITELDPKTPPEIVDYWMNYYHMNDPLIVRYFQSIADLFSPTMGMSWTSNTPVAETFWPAFSLSLQIGLIGLALSIVIGIPLGFALARRNSQTSNFLSVIVAVIAFAIPTFVIGIIFALISFSMGLTSIFTYGDWYVILIAALALAIPVGFGYARYLRQSVKEEYEQQYVKLARIKGCSESRVLWNHVAKPSLFPIINYLPLLVVGLVIGSVSLETIFAIPGTGSMMVDAAQDQDQTTLLAISTFYTLLIVIAMFIRDIWVKGIDPRMKES